MKTSYRSLTALFIAIGLHGIILMLFLSPDEIYDDTPTPPKRFGVFLSEEPTLSETLTPPSDAEDKPDPSPTPSASSHPKQPEPESASEAPAAIPAVTGEKPYTRSDIDTLPRSVIHHYGEKFFELSAGEQHYIIDNLQRIRKLNELVGTRLLRERPDEEIDPDDSNIVEFTLHPDGTVSDLQLQKNRVGTLLDELTLQTINLAHPKYPRPEQPTLIRIRVYIVVK